MTEQSDIDIVAGRYGQAARSRRGPCNSAPPVCVRSEPVSVAPPHVDNKASLAAASPFVPGLVGHSLRQSTLPAKQELAILFVDIADSTSTILRQPPEVALTIVQRVMGTVTDIALAHCGDVKDYEGDGALLYFGSISQATRAALAIRTALPALQAAGDVPLQARFSANVGEVIVGLIGSPLRRSVALIGPAVHLASRLLKHIPPGGIIAPQAAVARLAREAPDLAQPFQLWGQCLILKGFEEECVTAYHIPTMEDATVRKRPVVS